MASGPITEIVKSHFHSADLETPLGESLRFWAENDTPDTGISVSLTTPALAMLTKYSIGQVAALQKVCYELAGAIDVLVNQCRSEDNSARI
jgi:hypothetical protein